MKKEKKKVIEEKKIPLQNSILIQYIIFMKNVFCIGIAEDEKSNLPLPEAIYSLDGRSVFRGISNYFVITPLYNTNL